MGNKRKLNKYKNVPKFNFATVGIAIGVGLIVLLLVFFFKITFEEPNVNVVGSVEQRGSKVAKTTNPPKKVVVKPQKEGKPSIGGEKKTREKEPSIGGEKKTREKDSIVIITPPQEAGETAKKNFAQKKEVSKPSTTGKVVKKESHATKPKEKPSSTRKIIGRVVYVIQIGSFRDKKRALLLKKTMVKRGYKIKIVKGIVKGKTWYRVRVGSGSDKESISELMQRLKGAKVFGMNLKPIVMR